MGNNSHSTKKVKDVILILTLVVMVGFLGVKFTKIDSVSSMTVLDANVATPFHFIVKNEYTRDLGPIGRQYEWIEDSQTITDVHKEATFSVVDLENFEEAATYEWLIDGKTFSGHSITYTFTAVDDYPVILRKVVDGEDIETYEGKVSTKYVRREVRQLSDEDRHTFLQTLKVLYDVSQHEGEKLYGSDYLSIESLVLTHLELAGDFDCDHLHDGLGFMTQHSALTNMMEKSLQSVDPSVSCPYWDYTIEGQDISNAGEFSVMCKSDIFKDDWFGALHPEGDGVVKEGLWAYTPISTVNTEEFSVYSPYSLARSPWSANKVPYLTRYSDLYGASYEVMPTCTDHYDLLFFDTFYDFAIDSQYLPHGSVHIVVGGVTNSDIYGTMTSHGMDEDSAYTLSTLGFYYQKNLWRDGDYVCQSGCDISDESQDCTCSCPALETWKTKEHDYILNSLGLDDDFFVTESGEDVLNVFLDILCNSDGVSSSMIGDMLQSGSPVDPLFWPIHPTVERLFFRWTMTGDRTLEWVDDPFSCSGHFSDDKISFFEYDGRSDWTNLEIFNLLNPSSDNLDYVYHSFYWEHCDGLVPVDFEPNEKYYTGGEDYSPTSLKKLDKDFKNKKNVFGMNRK